MLHDSILQVHSEQTQEGGSDVLLGQVCSHQATQGRPADAAPEGGDHFAIHLLAAAPILLWEPSIQRAHTAPWGKGGRSAGSLGSWGHSQVRGAWSSLCKHTGACPAAPCLELGAQLGEGTCCTVHLCRQLSPTAEVAGDAGTAGSHLPHVHCSAAWGTASGLGLHARPQRGGRRLPRSPGQG